MTWRQLLRVPSSEVRSEVSDYLAVALAVSLPWSTSATGVLAGIWLISSLPNLAVKSSRQVLFSPAAALPVLLVLAAGLGLLWAQVTWADRLDGLTSFLKLLCLPLLVLQFSRSPRAGTAMMGFVISCVLLATVSWLSFFWPGLLNRPGIVVKDYIAQSAMLTVCMFLLAPAIQSAVQERHYRFAATLLVLEFLLVLNIFFIATSRTYLVVVPILLACFGYRAAGWKCMTALFAAFFVVAAVSFPFSSFLQSRAGGFFHELEIYNPKAAPTSAGERLTFWMKSLRIIETAPLLGHGTGSIHEQFRRVAGEVGMSAEIPDNPHNQILAVGIQLGALGIVLLLAMWAAHAVLFNWNSASGWAGFVIVLQNVVGSLFNSHLFDFTHGWLYVVGVGIAGGVAMRDRFHQMSTKRDETRMIAARALGPRT